MENIKCVNRKSEVKLMTTENQDTKFITTEKQDTTFMSIENVTRKKWLMSTENMSLI